MDTISNLNIYSGIKTLQLNKIAKVITTIYKFINTRETKNKNRNCFLVLLALFTHNNLERNHGLVLVI